MVGVADLSHFLPEILADLPAAFPVLHPELTDILMIAGKSKTVLRLGMIEIGGVKVQADAHLLRKLHPVGKMFRLNLVPLDIVDTAVVQIHRMSRHFFLSGDQLQGLFQMLKIFRNTLRLSPRISRRRQTAGKLCVKILKPGQIVDLPAVDGNRDLGQLF